VCSALPVRFVAAAEFIAGALLRSPPALGLVSPLVLAAADGAMSNPPDGGSLS
jgi:hypothetical protein